jgi:hypothetical protein
MQVIPANETSEGSNCEDRNVHDSPLYPAIAPGTRDFAAAICRGCFLVEFEAKPLDCLDDLVDIGVNLICRGCSEFMPLLLSGH